MQPAHDVSTLYTDFRSRIYGYLRRLTKDDGLADDLTQETFLRVREHLATFRGDGEIGNWLYRIATNLFRDSLRTQSRTLQFSGSERDGTDEQDDLLSQIPDPGPPPVSILERRAVTHCVHACIADVPPRYRAALVLSAIEGKTVAESATILGCSPEALKVRLHRGRHVFKALAAARCDITAARGGAVDCQPKEPHRTWSRVEQL
jgi:RNA polymerase sigma-70 factor (ECF subfamily)